MLQGKTSVQIWFSSEKQCTIDVPGRGHATVRVFPGRGTRRLGLGYRGLATFKPGRDKNYTQFKMTTNYNINCTLCFGREPDLYTCFSLQHNLSTYFLTKNEYEHLKITKFKMTTNYNINCTLCFGREPYLYTCFSLQHNLSTYFLTRTEYEHLKITKH